MLGNTQKKKRWVMMPLAIVLTIVMTFGGLFSTLAYAGEGSVVSDAQGSDLEAINPQAAVGMSQAAALGDVGGNGVIMPDPNVKPLPDPDGVAAVDPNVKPLPDPDGVAAVDPNVKPLPDPDGVAAVDPNVKPLPDPDGVAAVDPNVKPLPDPDGVAAVDPNVKPLPDPDGVIVVDPNAVVVPGASPVGAVVVPPNDLTQEDVIVTFDEAGAPSFALSQSLIDQGYQITGSEKDEQGGYTVKWSFAQTVAAGSFRLPTLSASLSSYVARLFSPVEPAPAPAPEPEPEPEPELKPEPEAEPAVAAAAPPTQTRSAGDGSVYFTDADMEKLRGSKPPAININAYLIKGGVGSTVIVEDNNHVGIVESGDLFTMRVSLDQIERGYLYSGDLSGETRTDPKTGVSESLGLSTGGKIVVSLPSYIDIKDGHGSSYNVQADGAQFHREHKMERQGDGSLQLTIYPKDILMDAEANGPIITFDMSFRYANGITPNGLTENLIKTQLIYDEVIELKDNQVAGGQAVSFDEVDAPDNRMTPKADETWTLNKEVTAPQIGSDNIVNFNAADDEVSVTYTITLDPGKVDETGKIATGRQYIEQLVLSDLVTTAAAALNGKHGGGWELKEDGIILPSDAFTKSDVTDRGFTVNFAPSSGDPLVDANAYISKRTAFKVTLTFAKTDYTTPYQWFVDNPAATNADHMSTVNNAASIKYTVFGDATERTASDNAKVLLGNREPAPNTAVFNFYKTLKHGAETAYTNLSKSQFDKLFPDSSISFAEHAPTFTIKYKSGDGPKASAAYSVDAGTGKVAIINLYPSTVYTVTEVIPAGSVLSKAKSVTFDITVAADGSVAVSGGIREANNNHYVDNDLPNYRILTFDKRGADASGSGEYLPLAGAVFELYTDAAAQNAVRGSRATSGANGKVTIPNLAAGATYYLKELSAPMGYAKDTAVYKITIPAGGTTIYNWENSTTADKSIRNELNGRWVQFKKQFFDEAGIEVKTGVTMPKFTLYTKDAQGAFVEVDGYKNLTLNTHPAQMLENGVYYLVERSLQSGYTGKHLLADGTDLADLTVAEQAAYKVTLPDDFTQEAKVYTYTVENHKDTGRFKVVKKFDSATSALNTGALEFVVYNDVAGTQLVTDLKVTSSDNVVASVDATGTIKVTPTAAALQAGMTEFTLTLTSDSGRAGTKYYVEEKTSLVGYVAETGSKSVVLVPAYKGIPNKVEFTNEKANSLQVKKVGYDGKALAGAIFHLYEKGPNASDTYVAVLGVDGKNLAATTDAAGIAMFGGIKNGYSYRVMERDTHYTHALDVNSPYVSLPKGNNTAALAKVNSTDYAGAGGTTVTSTQASGEVFTIGSISNKERVKIKVTKKDQMGKVMGKIAFTLDHMSSDGITMLYQQYLETNEGGEVTASVAPGFYVLREGNHKGNSVSGLPSLTEYDIWAGSLKIQAEDDGTFVFTGTGTDGYVTFAGAARAATVDVTNHKKAALTITKYGDTMQTPGIYNKLLENAKFQIFEKVGVTPLTFTLKDGVYTLDTASTETELSTDSDGKIEVKGLDQRKTYTIKETAAPAGYIIKTETQDVAFKGEANANVLSASARFDNDIDINRVRIQKGSIDLATSEEELSIKAIGGKYAIFADETTAKAVAKAARDGKLATVQTEIGKKIGDFLSMSTETANWSTALSAWIKTDAYRDLATGEATFWVVELEPPVGFALGTENIDKVTIGAGVIKETVLGTIYNPVAVGPGTGPLPAYVSLRLLKLGYTSLATGNQAWTTLDDVKLRIFQYNEAMAEVGDELGFTISGTDGAAGGYGLTNYLELKKDEGTDAYTTYVPGDERSEGGKTLRTSIYTYSLAVVELIEDVPAGYTGSPVMPFVLTFELEQEKKDDVWVTTKYSLVADDDSLLALEAVHGGYALRYNGLSTDPEKLFGANGAWLPDVNAGDADGAGSSDLYDKEIKAVRNYDGGSYFKVSKRLFNGMGKSIPQFDGSFTFKLWLDAAGTMPLNLADGGTRNEFTIDSSDIHPTKPGGNGYIFGPVKPGTYWIEEVSAPAGINKIAALQAFTVTAEHATTPLDVGVSNTMKLQLTIQKVVRSGNTISNSVTEEILYTLTLRDTEKGNAKKKSVTLTTDANGTALLAVADALDDTTGTERYYIGETNFVSTGYYTSAYQYSFTVKDGQIQKLQHKVPGATVWTDAATKINGTNKTFIEGNTKLNYLNPVKLDLTVRKYDWESLPNAGGTIVANHVEAKEQDYLALFGGSIMVELYNHSTKLTTGQKMTQGTSALETVFIGLESGTYTLKERLVDADGKDVDTGGKLVLANDLTIVVQESFGRTLVLGGFGGTQEHSSALGKSGRVNDTLIAIYNAKQKGVVDIVKHAVGNASTTLAGAQFAIYNRADFEGDLSGPIAGKTPVSVVNTGADGKARVALMIGEYVIYETKAPTGYDLPAQADRAQVVTVGKFITMADVVTVTFADPAHLSIKLLKIDAATDKPISNPAATARARFKLEQETAGEYTSIKNNMMIGLNGLIDLGSLGVGAYRITETAYPGGYEQTTPATIDFSVERSATGALTLKAEDEDRVPDTNTLLMKNSADGNSLTIKKSANSAVVVPDMTGAEFSIYGVVNGEVEVSAIATATIITETNMVLVAPLPSKNTAGVVYTGYSVVETKAPAGYLIDKQAKREATLVEGSKSEYEVSFLDDQIYLPSNAAPTKRIENSDDTQNNTGRAADFTTLQDGSRILKFTLDNLYDPKVPNYVALHKFTVTDAQIAFKDARDETVLDVDYRITNISVGTALYGPATARVNATYKVLDQDGDEIALVGGVVPGGKTVKAFSVVYYSADGTSLVGENFTPEPIAVTMRVEQRGLDKVEVLKITNQAALAFKYDKDGTGKEPDEWQAHAPSTNLVTWSTKSAAKAVPQISVGKKAPALAPNQKYKPGNEYDYTLTLKNEELVATGLMLEQPVLIDILPEYMTLATDKDGNAKYTLKITDAAGKERSAADAQLVIDSGNARGLAWRIGEPLAPQEKVTVVVTVRVDNSAYSGVGYVNTVYATSLERNPKTISGDEHKKKGLGFKAMPNSYDYISMQGSEKGKGLFGFNILLALVGADNYAVQANVPISMASEDAYTIGKLISKTQGDYIPGTITIEPGDPVYYLITAKNAKSAGSGTNVLNKVSIADNLPLPGDKDLGGANRGTEWKAGTFLNDGEILSVTVKEVVDREVTTPAIQPSYTLYTSNTMMGKTWGTASWGSPVAGNKTIAATARSFKIVLDPKFELKANQRVEVEVKFATYEEESPALEKLQGDLGKVGFNSAGMYGVDAATSGQSVQADSPKVGVVLQPKSIAIGDRVWLDANNDGLQVVPYGNVEIGVAKIPVKLYRVESGVGVLVSEKVTDADGIYHFDATDGLKTSVGHIENIYFIEFDVTGTSYAFTKPFVDAAGGTQTEVDSDAHVAGLVEKARRTPNFKIGYDATEGGRPVYVDDPLRGKTVDAMSFDAGIYIPASIGDYVWFDEDDDGIQDVTENGVQGVRVSLLDGVGAPVLKNGKAYEALTDAQGEYLFDNLHPGDYQIRIDISGAEWVNYEFAHTGMGNGTNDARAMDFAPTDVKKRTGTMSSVTLASGENDRKQDAGLVGYRLGAVGDRVWLDTDLDGLQNDLTDNDAEFGVDGVVVSLYKAKFEAGSYVPDGAAIATMTTGEEKGERGRYLFEDQLPGQYILEFDPSSVQVQSGVSLGFTQDNAAGATDADNSDASAVGKTDASGKQYHIGRTTMVEIKAGETNRDVDAGLIVLGSIGDFVWNDTNHDGVQNRQSEPGLNGISVQLLDAAGKRVETDHFGNTLMSETEQDAQAGSGYYSFKNLTPGTEAQGGRYHVQFGNQAGGVTYGYTEPFNAGAAKRVIAGMETTFDYETMSNILNPNDSDGSLAAGKTRAITLTMLGAFDRAASIGGKLVFTDGTVSGSQRLINDQTDQGLWLPTALGDLVWHDANANGLQDAGEAGIPGVSVTLYQLDRTATTYQAAGASGADWWEKATLHTANSAAPFTAFGGWGAKLDSSAIGNYARVGMATTDANGRYKFEDLDPVREYRVHFEAPAEYPDMSPMEAGTEREKDSNMYVGGAFKSYTKLITGLRTGQDDLSIDAGFYKKDESTPPPTFTLPPTFTPTPTATPTNPPWTDETPTPVPTPTPSVPVTVTNTPVVVTTPPATATPVASSPVPFVLTTPPQPTPTPTPTPIPELAIPDEEVPYGALNKPANRLVNIEEEETPYGPVTKTGQMAGDVLAYVGVGALIILAGTLLLRGDKKKKEDGIA